MIDTLAEPIFVELTTSAVRAASQNWAANLQALRQTQPTLFAEIENLTVDVEWVYGRDGSLTAMEEPRRWWGGCSLPARAADYMLRKAELPSTVACFLYPQHAGQLRFTLDRMESGQALIALIPESRVLRVILSCDDFSTEIAAHRFFLAGGENWEVELERLLKRYPGLPTPTQFIRPILSDCSPADLLVEPAQKIFAAQSTRRSARVKELRESWHRSELRRICLIAPSHFRLWDDTGAALSALTEDRKTLRTDSAELTFLRFDSNNPASASPLALAEAAAECDGIVSPNIGRADLPGIVPDDMPWATWITSPRIPSPDAAGKWDTLLVADPQWKDSAIARGWSPQRIFIAGWPDATMDLADEITPPGVFRLPDKPVVAIICNTRPLDPPAKVEEYSSHRLLWEAIRHELLENPFALKKSADDFLSDRMQQARLDDGGFDRGVFIDALIVNAWQQGIARFLLRERIPLRLFGTGWSDLEDFENHAAGPLKSRDQLSRAIRSSTVLIHAWPAATAHPIEATGKPVVLAHQQRDALIRDIRKAMAGRFPGIRRAKDRLSVRQVIRAMSVCE